MLLGMAIRRSHGVKSESVRQRCALSLVNLPGAISSILVDAMKRLLLVIIVPLLALPASQYGVGRMAVL